MIQLCDSGTSVFAFQGPFCLEFPGQADLSLHQFQLVRILNSKYLVAGLYSAKMTNYVKYVGTLK